MESNSTKYTFDARSKHLFKEADTKYAYDARSEALFKEADKLLESVGPSILNDSNGAPPDTGKTPTTHTKQYWQLL